jgi:ATP-dependent DNA ligase
MSLVDRSRLEIKLGGYAIGPASALSDTLLLSRVQDYRRQTAARMAPLEAGDVRKRLPSADYHVSRKIDGEFNVLVFDGDTVLTVNPGGTVRTGLPAFTEAASLCKRAGVQRMTVAGELHFVRPDGKRPRVHDVSRAARLPDSTDDLNGLHFAAFDLMDVNGTAPAGNFDATWRQISDLFKDGERCRPVESVTVKAADEVEHHYRTWVGQGAEGAVVRSDAVGMFKIKPRHTIDAVVIGFTEGTEDRQGLVHDLLLALMRPDGTFHVLGRVGGGFREEERRGFLSDLKDMAVESDYVEVNEQVAYRMVRPEWVIEISVIDLISQSTRGTPVQRMVLNWDSVGQRFQIVRRLPLVSMISPQFVRRRDDKTVNPTDLRLQQIADLVEIPLLDRDARQFHLSPSQLLRREVYTKQLKGQMMVRKLVMWQTNKERESDDYPSFVIHYTDYSPNRKNPLDRDVRVSSSREQIDQLWTDLAEENVKKGWVREGGAPTPAPVVAAAAPPAGVAEETVAEPPAEPKKRARAPKKPKA